METSAGSNSNIKGKRTNIPETKFDIDVYLTKIFSLSIMTWREKQTKKYIYKPKTCEEMERHHVQENGKEWFVDYN